MTRVLKSGNFLTAAVLTVLLAVGVASLVLPSGNATPVQATRIDEPLNGPALAGALTSSLVLAPEPVLVAELLWQPREQADPPHKGKSLQQVWDAGVKGEGRPTIEELVQRLLEVRAKRAELDKQEREAVQVLRKQMEVLQQQLKQVGVLIEGDAPVVVVTPPAKPVVPTLPPVAPPTSGDELAAAWRTDRDGGQGTFQDLQALALAYRNAGEALERSRPPTVGHLIGGLEVRNRVQLKDRLPRVQVLCKQHLALKLPPSSTVLTPIVPAGHRVEQSPELIACKQVLIELASLLERVLP